MTQANDSILVTPGTGATVATHLAGGKEHQVVAVADEDGDIWGSADTWLLWQQPRVMTAAATDFFDLFNATGSGKVLRIRSLYAIRTVTAALATVPHWEFAVIRTSAVGTGGTAVVAGASTAPPAAGVLSLQDADTANTALPATITARSLPTGGATAEAFLFSTYLQALHSATLWSHAELMSGVNLIPELPHANPFILREAQGLKVRQITATASTGVAFGWLIAFAVI